LDENPEFLEINVNIKHKGYKDVDHRA
jgi:hypothetical protein